MLTSKTWQMQYILVYIHKSSPSLLIHFDLTNSQHRNSYIIHEQQSSNSNYNIYSISILLIYFSTTMMPLRFHLVVMYSQIIASVNYSSILLSAEYLQHICSLYINLINVTVLFNGTKFIPSLTFKLFEHTVKRRILTMSTLTFSFAIH